MELVYAIAAVASSLAAVLAWVAKIWWGREYAAAKEAEIKAKDAHVGVLEREIESLRELTPMRIREYFLSMRSQLEEYNSFLQGQLDAAGKEVAAKQIAIDELLKAGSQQDERITRLTEEKKAIAGAAATLEGQVSVLRAKYEGEDTVVLKVPRFNPEAFKQIQISSMALRSLTTTSSSLEAWKKALGAPPLTAQQLSSIGEALADFKSATSAKTSPGKQGS